MSKRKSQYTTHLGNRLVCICGSNGQGGLYAPLGYWYKEGGLFWVDLKSTDQWYSEVSKDTIANKRLGGFPTKEALRAYVMEYWSTKGGGSVSDLTKDERLTSEEQ